MKQGIDELIQENSTAFYTFDVGELYRRIDYLKSHLPSDICLCYAVKANPFIIKEADRRIDKLEICSPGEARICNALGVSKKKMVISGVYKTPEFIESLAADESFDGVFTVESMHQFSLLSGLSEKYRRNIQLLIRLTNDSQFGVNESDIREIIINLKKHPFIHCCGIQYFSGTQKTSVKKLRREIEHLDALLIDLKDEYGFEAETLEYGTGFPVSYFENDEFDEDAYMEEFSQILAGMSFRTKIILEVGRSLAASCGRYYTHIVDIKTNKGMNYALVDGGMHHIVYYGQQMAMKRPKLTVVGKENDDNADSWAICGSLCSMNDIIAKQIPLPEIGIGDTICFENAGAYCMTEGISLFLSRDIPAVYLIHENGDVTCVREAFETSQLNTPKYERN